MRVVYLLLAVSAFANAQQPRIVNAKLETRQAAAGFASQFRTMLQGQTGPMWIGYAQPVVSRDHNSCCYHSSDSGSFRGCSLENRRTMNGQAATPGGPVQLEGPSHVVVLFRVTERAVEKIRTFSLDCDLDAGGLPLVWFTAVPSGESLSLLSSFVVDNESDVRERRRLSESAVSAIALHAGDAAGALLEKYAVKGPENQRKNAIFWLGNARGTRGFEVVSRIAGEDSSDKVREHAIFAMSQSKDSRAIDRIIQIARNDKSAHVRGQALFWLAQKAGSKAAGAITSAIQDDPDTKVKERAIFALSQLPKDQGVPLLIEQARTNKNPVVRKRALFWLGQSKDPRALTFIEELLTR